MSVKNENAAGGESVVLERPAAGGVYASLFKKINLNPVSELSALDIWQDAQAMSDATADERLTAGMQVFLECLTKAGSKVEKLDKNLIDHHIAELDYQISRQLDAVMHHEDFQAVESLWRGVKSLVDKTDFRQNVKVELLDMSKEDLRQDFEDCPEIIQSGLYKHTYIDEYDTPGGEPIAALISAYEFDASAQDVTLLRNISKVSAAAHMPFIGSAGPKFFLKDSMEEVAAIKDIGNYFDRAEYIKWKSFRETDDSRYIGLVMPRVLGRLPYGPDTVTCTLLPACWVRWVPLLAFSLASCGVTQSVTDGTKSAFNAVFYKKIKVLHLDFTAREALNTDSRESNSLSEPVVVRVYQLKDRKTFDKMVYQQLLKDGETILKADLLATRDVVVKPGGDANLSMPMEEEAKYVAVVGLFRHPDMVNNTWKLVTEREDLDPDKPRILEAGNNHLTLQPLKDD